MSSLNLLVQHLDSGMGTALLCWGQPAQVVVFEEVVEQAERTPRSVVDYAEAQMVLMAVVEAQLPK